MILFDWLVLFCITCLIGLSLIAKIPLRRIRQLLPFAIDLYSVYILCVQAMPLRLTSAPVSGIKKRKSTSTTTRARSSPFAAHPRTKLRSNTDDTAKDATPLEDEDFDLPDLGLSQHISSTTSATTVLEAIHHIRSTMFDDLPATRTGMNSTRIAEVLNFRRSLPPLVSVAHVHTLLDAPTRTEREIVELVTAGKVRRNSSPCLVASVHPPPSPPASSPPTNTKH